MLLFSKLRECPAGPAPATDTVAHVVWGAAERVATIVFRGSSNRQDWEQVCAGTCTWCSNQDVFSSDIALLTMNEHGVVAHDL